MSNLGSDAATCPFCGIVSGEQVAHRVYADDAIFAILDRRPIHPYHLLVIPTIHVADFYELDEAVYTQLMRVAQRLAAVVKVLASPKKVGLLIAGFDVPHTHVHIIPMHHYHDITSKRLLDGSLVLPSSAELAANAARIAEALRSAEWAP
jgi:histidine triad (HIT) family protein